MKSPPRAPNRPGTSASPDIPLPPRQGACPSRGVPCPKSKEGIPLWSTSQEIYTYAKSRAATAASRSAGWSPTSANSCCATRSSAGTAKAVTGASSGSARYPASYVAGGRLVVEIRATLASLVLAAVEVPDETDVDPAGLAGQQPVAKLKESTDGIVDPKPESGPVKPDTATPPDGGQTAATGNTKNGHPAQNDIFPPMGNPDGDGADAHLFGILWPLGDAVKLDTSVNRSLFRRQKERIKALGYAFQASGQRWVRA